MGSRQVQEGRDRSTRRFEVDRGTDQFWNHPHR
jgi:hypothetical protein